MRIITTLTLSIMTFFSLFGQAKVESGTYNLMLKGLLSHTVPEINISKAVESDALFLDARAAEEHAISYIKDAHFVGYDKFDLASVKDIPKDQKIIVYCSVGYRSEKVAEQLLEAGFTDVANLYGGIFEWKNQGQTIYDTEGTTENVHAFNKAWGIWLKKGTKVYND